MLFVVKRRVVGCPVVIMHKLALDSAPKSAGLTSSFNPRWTVASISSTTLRRLSSTAGTLASTALMVRMGNNASGSSSAASTPSLAVSSDSTSRFEVSERAESNSLTGRAHQSLPT